MGTNTITHKSYSSSARRSRAVLVLGVALFFEDEDEDEDDKNKYFSALTNLSAQSAAPVSDSPNSTQLIAP